VFVINRIPDSAAEPDLEIHPTTDPVIIPLDDVTGNPDSVNDFQNTPWPEPKPIIIPQSPPPQFQQPQPPSFGSFPNQTFPGPQQMFPNQTGMPNNMPMPGGMMVPNSVNNMNPMGGMNNMGSGGGDWRVSIN
jgi:protein phosphatase 1 regulatory subunit 10